LATDDWVIGLAAAIAIGYASVVFVRSVVQVVVDVSRDTTSGGLSVEVAGRTIAYETPVLAGVTLLALVLLSALLLRRARTGP
jgi:hypothetical protein